MPDVAGGLAFEYNLQGANGQRIKNLILNGPTLEGIFTGSIRNWNNPAIQALNPGIPLPNQTITAYYRSDPSGENYLLSDYFLHVDPGPHHRVPAEAGVPAPGQPVGHLGLLQQRHPAQPEHLGPGERRRRRIAGARTDPRCHLLRRDRLRQERGAAGGIGRERRRRCRPAVVVQRGGGAHGSDPVLGPDAESGRGIHESQPGHVSALCVQLLRGPVRAFGRPGAEFRACDSGGAVTMGTTQGAEMAQFITYVACARPEQNGEPRLFAVTAQPRRGRLPGRGAPPGWHRTAGADRPELRQPLHHGCATAGRRPHALSGRRPGRLRRYGRRGSRRRGGSSQRRRGSQYGKGRDDGRYRRGCRRFGRIGGRRVRLRERVRRRQRQQRPRRRKPSTP